MNKYLLIPLSTLAFFGSSTAWAQSDDSCYLTLPAGVNMGVQAVYAKPGQSRDLCFIQGAGDVTAFHAETPAGWTLAKSGNRLTVTAGKGAANSKLDVSTPTGTWRFALMPQS
ncbi:hypothetical protein [Amphibiibacter pelophylacis]|uniref:Uncharacterized protein n=1 Tax=Amphibiibacter pelophylacis TaxID=1799477 RepID=A0ACC6NZJ6_9BURK